MGPDEHSALLAIARSSVLAAARGEPPPPPPPLPVALREKGAAFVTLRRDGELRGCIGHVEARLPLWQSVQEMARAAAERDSRFAAVRPEEVPHLSIDISVLSPMRRARPEEIEVGRHGLYIRHNGASGLLLPQVPVEWGWDRATFLRETCRKAGLPPDAFLDPAAELFVFTAEVLEASPESR